MSKSSGSVPASNRGPASAPSGSKNTASTAPRGKKPALSTTGPAVPRTNFATVSNVYRDIWSKTPYTSYVMFDHLLKHAPAGASPRPHWDTFLASQVSTLGDAGLGPVATPTDNDRGLWSGQSGLCTSFAIRVATEARVAGIQYGNQRKRFKGRMVNVHRAGWEIGGTSAIVIDSSARQTILFNNINQPFRIKDATWAFQEGEILLHTARGVTAPFAPCDPKGPEGWKAAMQICLEQLLPQTEMILMFRAVQGNNIGFAGTVRWDFQRHTCTFSTLKTKDVTVVTFAGAHTSEPSVSPGAHTSGSANASGAHTASPPVALGTEPDIALQLFWDWINQPRVPSRKAQFSPELQEIHAQLWQAALMHWGTPTIEQPPDGELPKGNASPASGAAGSGAAVSTINNPRAQAPVAMRTAPGSQPVPGGLTGSLAKVGLNALMNVKQ